MRYRTLLAAMCALCLAATPALALDPVQVTIQDAGTWKASLASPSVTWAQNNKGQWQVSATVGSVTWSANNMSTSLTTSYNVSINQFSITTPCWDTGWLFLLLQQQ